MLQLPLCGENTGQSSFCTAFPLVTLTHLFKYGKMLGGGSFLVVYFPICFCVQQAALHTHIFIEKTNNLETAGQVPGVSALCTKSMRDLGEEIKQD